MGWKWLDKAGNSWNWFKIAGMAIMGNYNDDENGNDGVKESNWMALSPF